MKLLCTISVLACSFLGFSLAVQAQETPAVPTSASQEKVIIDTDIGDDIDDAFAAVLALRSPELRVLGFTTTFGDTQLRAKLLDRLLIETGHADVPVAVGSPTSKTQTFSQQRYALAHPDAKRHEDAVDFILEQIRKSPDQITLVAIGPLMNVGALIDKDLPPFEGSSAWSLWEGRSIVATGIWSMVPSTPLSRSGIFSTIPDRRRSSWTLVCRCICCPWIRPN